MPAYLRPCGPYCERAILTGDPARAMALAQALTEKPQMSNHARGLWGYHGLTAAGAELNVQATGIGAPSAIAVLADLAELGVRRAVRVDGCAAAPSAGAELGERIQVEAGGAGRIGITPILGAAPPADADVHDDQTQELLEAAATLGVEASALLIVSSSAAGAALGEDELAAALAAAAAVAEESL